MFTRNLAVLLMTITAGSIGGVSRNDPVVGKPAPEFTARDTKGRAFDLASQRGKWVVLEWFNHQCPFTGKQYNSGNMQKLQRTYTARGVEWVSIVSSAPGHDGFTTDEKANDLVRSKHAAPTLVIRDTSGSIGHLYRARNTPQMFVIDPTGRLVYQGAIDDKRTADTADVRTAHNYVAAALDEAMAGKRVAVPMTQPYGCTVQYATPDTH